MKIKTSKRKDDTYSLEIEEEHSVLNAAMDKSFKKVSKTAKLPGFRQGKVPRHLFEQHYGREVLIQEAVIDVVNVAYMAAIQELKLNVIDQPKNVDIKEYKENEPISFSLEVDVRPEVKLGKYKGLKASKQTDGVDDAKVDEQITALRENYADYATAEKAVGQDDIVRADVEAKIEDTVYEQWSRQNVGFKIGAAHFGPDFDTNVVGLSKDQEKEFTTIYNDDFSNADVAGKTVAFSVKIQEVRERTLPELNDAFVLKATQDEIKTVDELKTKVREEIESRLKHDAETKLHNELIEAACDDAKVNIQDVLVERQLDESMKDFGKDLSRSGITIDQYVKMVNKPLEEVRETFREGANKQVKAELVLDAIKEKENIEATAEDMEEEVRRMKMPNVSTDEEIKNYVSKLPLDGFKYMVERRKTIDFLVDNAKIK